jgi:hypothetical protein
MGGKLTFVNRAGLQSFTRHMARKTGTSNDNQLHTRAELEASNRELRASLKRCEALVSDCKDKLALMYGLKRPDEPAER